MTRRGSLAICVSLLLAACSTSDPSLEEALPSQVAGWTRSQASSLANEAAPDLIRSLGLKRAVTASYSGPEVVHVRVYEMNVSTSAFELIQKWRQQNGLAVYTGPYFIVADPTSGPAAAGLLEALRKHLE